jgi:hypothetical protein
MPSGVDHPARAAPAHRFLPASLAFLAAHIALLGAILAIAGLW